MKYFSTAPGTFFCPAGFSLVETLVAISILLLVVVGPLTISSRTAKSSTYASELLTAQMLAQEGLELADKARNDYVLENYQNVANGGWDNFATPASTNFGQCFDSDGCGLAMNDATDDVVVPVVACNPAGSPNPCQLYQSAAPSTRARYSHDSAGAVSPFTRTVRFYPVPSFPDQIRVESIVMWRTGSLVANQIVDLDTYFFNIYDR